MKRAFLMVGILVAGLFSAVSTAAPANAGTCTVGLCGFIRHYTPDSGLNVPILIRCDYGDATTNHNLWEGENSNKYCRDTDQVYNRDGQEIWCKTSWVSDGVGIGHYVFAKMWDATGWYKINDIFNDGDGCTVRAD